VGSEMCIRDRRVEKPSSRPHLPDYLCPYCGERKDPITGQCACSVLPGSAPPVAISAASPSAASPPLSGATVQPAMGTFPSRLVIVNGVKAGMAFPLQGNVVTIGREPGRDLQIDFDPTVSRRHARLERQGTQWVLIDEGSRNGSFVNGQPVLQQAIRVGDVLRFGNTEVRVE